MIFLFAVVLISTWLAFQCTWICALIILCIFIFSLLLFRRFAGLLIISLVAFAAAFIQNQYNQATLDNPLLNHYQGWAYIEIDKPLVVSQSYKKYLGRVLVLSHTKINIPIILSQYSPINIHSWPQKYWLNIKIQKVSNHQLYGLIKQIAPSGYTKTKPWQLKSTIAQWIWHTNGNSKASAILLAIALGDRSYLTNDIWLTFARTGTSHLLAIAGLHLGVIVFIIWLQMQWLWRRTEKGMHVIPVQVASLSVAVLGAILYGYFTGWAIPCERASIMIIVLCFAQIGLLNLTMADRVFLAFAIILLVNPFDIYSQSYWLSFIAVVSICYGTQMRPNIHSWLKQWFYLNLIITCSLLPWSLYFFGQYALIGWLANLIAVPWVAFCLLPVVFFSVVIQPFFPLLNMHIWHGCAILLTPLWSLLVCMSQLPWAYVQMTPPFTYCLLFALGYFWLFAPKAVPGRYWAVLLMLPLLLSAFHSLPYATYEQHDILIGKQKAELIKSQRHLWLLVKDRTKVHLSQWDYKYIAADMGAFGLWHSLRVVDNPHSAIYMDGITIPTKTLRSAMKNSI